MIGRKKIARKGRDSVPENEDVNKFVYEVSQFLARQKQPKKHILVHCTHGHNRTGYASTYSGKIIECSWDSEENVWVCMRVRVDKGTPNEFNTYRKVMRSIRDNITEEELLNKINEIIRLPMYADRIQNESKAHNHNSSRRR